MKLGPPALPYAVTRPATARIWRGAASQIEIADTVLSAMQIQNAIV